MGGTRPPRPSRPSCAPAPGGRCRPTGLRTAPCALCAPRCGRSLILRVRGPEADDLLQDVWTIFYQRWRRWEHRPEMEAVGRQARAELPVPHLPVRGDGPPAEGAARGRDARSGGAAARRAPTPSCGRAEAGRCLELARRLLRPEPSSTCCSPSWPACRPARSRETLGVSESVVDHRFRGALARLRARLLPKARARGGGAMPDAALWRTLLREWGAASRRPRGGPPSVAAARRSRRPAAGLFAELEEVLLLWRELRGPASAAPRAPIRERRLDAPGPARPSGLLGGRVPPRGRDAGRRARVRLRDPLRAVRHRPQRVERGGGRAPPGPSLAAGARPVRGRDAPAPGRPAHALSARRSSGRRRSPPRPSGDPGSRVRGNVALVVSPPSARTTAITSRQIRRWLGERERTSRRPRSRKKE